MFKMRLFIGYIGALIGIMVLLPVTASAATYDVSASVDFPAPTQPAVITNGIGGTTVNSATLIVKGTCEALTPNGTVSIWRGGVPIGSGPCNGNFEITISLQVGANTLVARSASVSGLYGPDSAAATVTLVLPPVPQSTPLPTPPSPGSFNDTSQNAGAAKQLEIKPSQAFSTFTGQEAVVLLVVVEGGNTPYTIYINWGDGSEETRTVDKPGTYQFTHTYAKDDTYTVKGVVRDVLGATSSFSYAVVSKKPAANPLTLESPATVTPLQAAGFKWWWPIPYIMLGILIALLGYRLGVMRTSRATPSPGDLKKHRDIDDEPSEQP